MGKTMTENEIFEDYLCKRGDEIDQRAHALIETIAGKPIDWDISIIRELVETTEGWLCSKGIPYCDPYYETELDSDDEVPCFLGEPCMKSDCPMKRV